MERAEVHKKIGAPSQTEKAAGSEILKFNRRRDEIRFVDVHFYRGKLNSIDEGGGQAIANALTLGTAEVIMIPMTAAEIAIRSAQSHRVDVAYGSDSCVLDYSISAPPAKARDSGESNGVTGGREN